MGIDYNPSNCVISVGVSDYDRSLAWYRDVLGFEVVYELAEYGWCELSTPFGFNVGLGQNETVQQGNITPTFGVGDIDDAIAYLREHDVKVEDWHEISGMVRLSTFYDPDGTPWMLAQTLDEKEKFGREGAPAASSSSGTVGE
jgi:catechol 2,3-dioxygenase-like lactoylglutathione lyase family enzyme